MGHIPSTSASSGGSTGLSKQREPGSCVSGRSTERFIPTHTKGRALGGRVLATVGAVDSVPLDQLICRGVCPEVISSFHLRVLQCTGPHCGEEQPKSEGAIRDPISRVRRAQIWEHGFGKQVREVLPNKDARIGPSTGSIRRASFS